MLINERRIRNNLDGSGRTLIENINPEFTDETEVTPSKISIRISDIRARTEHLTDTSPVCYRYTNPLRRWRKLNATCLNGSSLPLSRY